MNLKPCGDCPFVRATPLDGAPDWLEDVMRLGQANPYFEHSCHKTDPKADGFAGAKKTRECAGHLRMMLNQFEKTPGKGGVYESLDKLIEAYLVHWAGKEKICEMRIAAAIQKSRRKA